MPVAYFFLKSLSGRERANIFKKCLEIIHETGAIVQSVTFDGAHQNKTMCTALGANFEVTNLRPWFAHPVTGK